MTVRLQFAGDEVTLTRSQNVGFNPAKSPVLVGRAN